jgi:hypothetical protein
MPLGEGTHGPSDGQQIRPRLPQEAEAGGPIDRPGERSMPAAAPAEADGAGHFLDVEGEPAGCGVQSVGQSAKEPRRGGADDGQPEQLHVQRTGVDAYLVEEGHFPRNDPHGRSGRRSTVQDGAHRKTLDL